MFEAFIVKPIFNALVFIYALLPGHNFGLALILFTILVRFLIHPLVKKQLHHNRAMQALQPEIDAIKKAAKGDNQKIAELTMELYKEREISPFSSIGTLFIQIIILIGLYTGLRHVAADPSMVVGNAYDWLKHFGTLQELAADISKFDFTLFGLVDLSRAANSSAGFYLPGFLLVLGSGVSQFFMGKQTISEDKDARSLNKILEDVRGGGEKVKQSEVQALLGKALKFLIPALIIFLTYSLPSAIALYWFVAGAVGYFQQRLILKQDEHELIESPGKSKKPTKAKPNRKN